MRRAAKHVAHRVIAVDFLPRLRPGQRHRAGNAQLLRHAPQLLAHRPFADDGEMHIRAGVQQPREHAHHLFEVLFLGDAADVQQQRRALRQAAFPAGFQPLLLAVPRRVEAGDVHAAGDDVNRRFHAVFAQQVERLARRGNHAVEAVAPPLGVFPGDPPRGLVRHAVRDVVGVVLPDGVIGVHLRAAKAARDVVAEHPHHEFAVGVHHVKIDLLRLPRCERRGEGEVAILEHQQRRARQIVHVFPLVLLPALAFRGVNVNLVAAPGQFPLQIQAARRHAVDFRVKRIGKQADFHVPSPLFPGVPGNQASFI